MHTYIHKLSVSGLEVYTYIHIFIYIYIYAYTYIHTQIISFWPRGIYIYTSIYIYLYICIYIHTYIHTQIISFWPRGIFRVQTTADSAECSATTQQRRRTRAAPFSRQRASTRRLGRLPRLASGIFSIFAGQFYVLYVPCNWVFFMNVFLVHFFNECLFGAFQVGFMSFVRLASRFCVFYVLCM